MKQFIRKQLFNELWQRLNDKVNLIQVIVGPRQIGKTTLALQIFEQWPKQKIYQSADQPGTPSLEWLENIWQQARNFPFPNKVLLIIDEIQKIPGWSGVVKKLYDEDRRYKRDIGVILLGSSSLLVQKGLSESLAGRFELHHHYQWSYAECHEFFNLKLEEYLFYGGYPGALVLKNDQLRWANYIRDSLIETVLAKDILLISPISKPALLRQTFALALNYPAQIISYQKMLGSLQDAGNTTTIASYFDLLAYAFLICPLERFSGSIIKQRGSSPKIIVYDNSLISVMNSLNFKEAITNPTWLGRLLENAVGARLKITLEKYGGQLFYWRDRQNEVDFIAKIGQKIFAIEVKFGKTDQVPDSLNIFARKHPETKKIIISDNKTANIDGISYLNYGDFFLEPERTIE